MADQHVLHPQAASRLHAPRPLPNPVMRVRGLTKVYGSGDTAVRALDSVTVDIARGRFTAIMGPSGSGKSTFMHCLAGFESITDGSVRLDDVEIAGMRQRDLTKLRRERVGFIFQSFNLIPTLTAAENIRLPQDIAHQTTDQARFDQVVDALDLRERLGHRPAELSGGQQQRVACARALMQAPTVLFADEPTGNLDSRSTEHVLTYLRRAVDEFAQTVVMVTHEPLAASYADTVLFLTDGRVVAQLDEPSADDILDALRALDPHAGTPDLGDEGTDATDGDAADEATPADLAAARPPAPPTPDKEERPAKPEPVGPTTGALLSLDIDPAVARRASARYGGLGFGDEPDRDGHGGA